MTRQALLTSFLAIVGSYLLALEIPLKLIGFSPYLLPDDLILMTGLFVVGLSLYYRFFIQGNRHYKSLNLTLDVMSMLAIAAHYSGIIDAASLLPYWLLIPSYRHVRKVKLFLDNFSNLSPVVYRLIPIVVFLPIVAHSIASVWIALGSGTAAPTDDKYLEYVRALYWTFTTLTTVGYGDISAQTPIQMLFASLVQIMGVGFFGYIVSNVASIMNRADAARDHHINNLDKIETFMLTHDIPVSIRARIRSYYHFLWHRKKGYSDSSILSGLPEKIKSEIFLHINKSIIEKVSFLKRASPELIEELMLDLQPAIYVPGEKIFKVGDPGDALYFIHSGHVDIVSREGKSVAHLKDGAFFGEMALLSDRERNATAVALSHCDIYSLPKSSFNRSIQFHPEFKKEIDEVARERSQSDMGSK